MQFYLNGFRPGDPDLAPAVTGDRGASDVLPATVDALIVGCGPAGLTLAAQLSAFDAISTCIVEQKEGPLQLGQADGVACRTMEMFNAFGFAERVLREAYWVNETSFWHAAADDPAKGLVRGDRIEDTEPGLSEFPHVILNQARVHDFYLDIMRKAPRRLTPHYGRRLVDLRVDRDTPEDHNPASYPVTAMFEHIRPGESPRIETISARYAIGCDGARSTVRHSIGQTLKGDSTNQAWGVMDVLAITDFPDIRLKSVINSAEYGTILLIPREGGYLVRIYIELDELDIGERVADRAISVGDLIAAAQRVLRPYTFEVKEVAWWSVYEIGQRLCDRFDDIWLDDKPHRAPRIFITGDACHTHSPKAGQGMNVSMQDAFNLGWKLAAVLEGRSAPALLRTYHDERQAIARELIAFDREWAAMLSAPFRSPDQPDGVDPADIRDYFVRSGHYTAGTATRYGPSSIIAEPAHQRLATGFPIGRRFHSAPVIRLGDAKPMELGHCLAADGRWRLFAFAAADDPLLANLCDCLARSSSSPILRHTPPGADIDSVIDVRAVLQTPHRDVALTSLSPMLIPRKGRFGLRDYEKVFCPDLAPERNIFDLRGIDRERGCLVIVRPDQYVANILPLDDDVALTAFFVAFLVDQTTNQPCQLDRA